MSNKEAAEYVCAGNRLVAPSDTPPAISALMLKCWDADPFSRPSFVEISFFFFLEEGKAGKEGGGRGGCLPSCTISFLNFLCWLRERDGKEGEGEISPAIAALMLKCSDADPLVEPVSSRYLFFFFL